MDLNEIGAEFAVFVSSELRRSQKVTKSDGLNNLNLILGFPIGFRIFGCLAVVGGVLWQWMTDFNEQFIEKLKSANWKASVHHFYSYHLVSLSLPLPSHKTLTLPPYLIFSFVFLCVCECYVLFFAEVCIFWWGICVFLVRHVCSVYKYPIYYILSVLICRDVYIFLSFIILLKKGIKCEKGYGYGSEVGRSFSG